MQDIITVTGMILKAEPVGEYDKRIVLLTKERGKLSAFARGVRRQGNRFMAAASPFCFGQFELYPGRKAYNLQGVHIEQYFEQLRTDYEKACYGFYFLEVADYYGRENNDDKELLKLLYQSLRALIHPAYDPRLVRAVYEIKAIAVNGEFPGLLKGISPDSACGYAITYIVTSSVEKLYSFRLSEEVLEELVRCAREYRTKCIPQKFKSLEILETCG
ncbi:MAG: DNA repair protein RecO [Lachnospiraceae bacterium]|nr:DNA repair protein RecO [Lachnospiraceae bacterium]